MKLKAKKLGGIILAIVMIAGIFPVAAHAGDVEINEITFPDENFRNFVKNHYGAGGILTETQIANVKTMDVSCQNICNLKGIEYFTYLENLNCEFNKLATLDVKGCIHLGSLDCTGNQLTTLDVSKCTSLGILNCSENSLESLDVSKCTSLVGLDCYSNQLEFLDVSKCTSLEKLDCTSNKLTTLDVSNCTDLNMLHCSSNKLTALDLSSCTKLMKLVCINNKLTSLNVSGCTGIKELECSMNELGSLDVSDYTNLKDLYCSSNKLTALNVNGCTGLEELSCAGNEIAALDVRGCTGLSNLSVFGNKGLTDLRLNSNLMETIAAETGTREDMGDSVQYYTNKAMLRADKEWGIHGWGTPEYDWSKDNITVTAKAKCTGETLTCVEKHEITEGPVDTTFEVVTLPGCETKGKIKYTAVFENKVFKKQEKTEEIPETGHTEVTITGKEATCTEKGLTDGKKCSVCEKILVAQEEIPAKDHTPADAVRENEIPATYEKEGSYDEVGYCSVCGDEISRETKSIEKQKKPSSGGGGSGIVSFILTYDTNGGEKIKSESHRVGEEVTLDKTPIKEGYTFTGWYADKELTKQITSVTINSSKTVYASWSDGTQPVNPDAPLMTIKIGSTKYQLNGADMEMDSAPFIDENDRTMLPVRVVANALGISDNDIAWDNETKTASFTRPDGKVVSCTVDEKVIRIGDEEIEIDTAPVIRNDRIYLPMRALFNAFNVSDAHIVWNGVNKTVTVTKEALEDIKALAEESTSEE